MQTQNYGQYLVLIAESEMRTKYGFRSQVEKAYDRLQPSQQNPKSQKKIRNKVLEGEKKSVASNDDISMSMNDMALSFSLVDQIVGIPDLIFDLDLGVDLELISQNEVENGNVLEILLCVEQNY